VSATTMNDTVIPVRWPGATMQVTETARLKASLAVRVLVHSPGDATPLPMLVRLPGRCATPALGGLVVFDGLRVELREVNGRMRPIVRADRVREVACDAAA